MGALASDRLRHFQLLLWNRWTEFNETGQEARSQSPLPSLCFSGRSEKQNGRPCLWLAETFLTSPLKPLNGIQLNLTGSTISTSSTKFVFFRPIRKTRWPPWPLICWDIFDFSSETAERNSKKLDRKQDLNVLYQVCVFRADRKNKMAALASDWLRHFRLLLWNRWTKFNETWQEVKSQLPLPRLCFSGRSEKTRWPPWPLIGWDIFDFSSETAERNSTKLDKKQDLNFLYQVCVFRADRKNKMAALASDLLRHFRLLLWNRWTEFNETWQEARSQSPLPSLCFSGRSEKTRWPPWPLIGWDIFDFSSETAGRNSTKLYRKQVLNVLYQVCVFEPTRKTRWPPWPLAETFSTSPLKPLNRIQRNLTGSKVSTSSTKFVFLGPIGKTRWPPWPLIGWDIFDFSSETAERNSTKLDRKQDLNVLYQVCVFRADQKKQDGHPGLWLAETFSTSPLKPLNGIQQNFTGSKFLMSSSKFVFFEPIRKTRWPPWPLAETFSTSPLKPLNGIQQNLTGSKISTSSTKFVFFGPIGKTRWPPWPLIGWDIFDFSETAEWNSTKLDRKQDLNVLYQVCVFLADRKNKMAALANPPKRWHIVLRCTICDPLGLLFIFLRIIRN